jgi:hypothetical protein
MVLSILIENHGIANPQAPAWLTTPYLDVKALSDLGKASLTSLACQVLKDMAVEPTRLATTAYWSPFVEKGLCLARAADAVKDANAVDSLLSAKPAGDCLVVGCKGDQVATLYVGQSNEVLRRTLEHRTVYEDHSIPAEKDGRLVYHLLKSCDEIYHFRLATLAEEDKKTRTMVEGL